MELETIDISNKFKDEKDNCLSCEYVLVTEDWWYNNSHVSPAQIFCNYENRKILIKKGFDYRFGVSPGAIPKNCPIGRKSKEPILSEIKESTDLKLEVDTLRRITGYKEKH